MQPIQTGWGEENQPRAVDGLQLTVSQTAFTWELGSTHEFDAAFKNIGQRSWLIDVFGDLNVRYGHWWTDPESKSEYWCLVWQRAPWEPEAFPRGSRQGGARSWREDQFTRLKPGDSYIKRLFYKLDSAPVGRFSVTLRYKETENRTLAWTTKHFPSERLWTGELLSNFITIEVVGASQSQSNAKM